MALTHLDALWDLRAGRPGWEGAPLGGWSESAGTTFSLNAHALPPKFLDRQLHFTRVTTSGHHTPKESDLG